MSSCPATPAKEKKFGVAVCRERKCPDLQKDPKWPDSPQQCQVTHGMPGSMYCCIKEMDPEHFIRHISGQLNNGPYTARPGPRNCPKECPYKILVDGEKFVFVKGKPESSKVPAKIGTCAFTGRPLNEWGVCPCNVLGNPRQEDQIKRLKSIVHARQKNTNPSIGLCNMGVCPDGKDRGAPDTEDDRCPVIRLPFGDINPGMGCPLWRIPAKMLPAPVTVPASQPDATDAKNATDIKKKQVKPAQMERGELESKQLTFADFGSDTHIFRNNTGKITGITTHERKKKSPRPAGVGTGGGPQPYTQHCCGTCGHWVVKVQQDSCREKDLREKFNESAEKNVAMMDIKKDTPRWFAALTTSKRRSCPGWFWEIWKIDPKKKGEWLYEGARTEKEAKEIKKQLESDEFHKGSRFEVRKRPDLCPEQNAMGGCMNGGWSCHDNTPERRKAVGCFLPIRPQVEKKGASKKLTKKGDD